MSEVAAGWYPDPSGRFEVRFHNGLTWTADVSSNGERFVDPLGITPQQTGDHADHPDNMESNRLATAAMVLGIVALAISWMPFVVVVGAIAAVLALVLGIVGVRRSTTSGNGRAFALTGIIMGAVGLVACALGVVLTVVVFDAIDRYEHPNSHNATITACELDGDTATLTGEITNLGDEPADFSVEVAFVRSGTDNAQHSTRIAVDDVAPGETESFDVNRLIALDTIDCVIQGVDGPLPFGIEIE